MWLDLKADSAGEGGYRGGMPPSDSNTNAAVEQMAQAVSGTMPPSDNYSDWAGPHIIIDWPVLLLNDAVIIAGVGLIVWIILRKQK